MARDREVRERQHARVEAIPIDRMRAPLAGRSGVPRRRLPGPASASSPAPEPAARPQRRTSSIVQGNGERASTTSPWRESSRTNERLDQWLRCPGVLPSARSRRRAPCSASATAARGAPRRAGGARRSAPSRQRVLGVGDVLEHLDRAREVELVRRRTAGSRPPSPGTRGSAPGARPSRPGSTPPRGRCRRPGPVAEALRPAVDEHALAAADVEQRGGAGPARTARRGRARSRAIRRRTTGFVEPYLS